MKEEKKMSEPLKTKPLILILIAGILLISSTPMSFANTQPTPTSLTIAVPSGPQSNKCTIEATLKDESGNPLPNMDIDFYECGSEKIGTAKTGSNGVASLTYTFPISTTYSIIANFSGTTNYAPSGSEYVDIKISVDNTRAKNTSYLVDGGIIAAVAIIGVVGYNIFRRRKKAITMPMTASAR